MKNNTVSTLLFLTVLSSAISLSFAAEVVIIQKDKSFSKAAVTIKKGDTITFKNEEKDITHNVYSLGPKNEFELKTQAPGTSSSVTFKDAGKTSVECAIHPGMKLDVTVE